MSNTSKINKPAADIENAANNLFDSIDKVFSKFGLSLEEITEPGNSPLTGKSPEADKKKEMENAR